VVHRFPDNWRAPSPVVGHSPLKFSRAGFYSFTAFELGGSGPGQSRFNHVLYFSVL
jgi:hypothetical protein